MEVEGDSAAGVSGPKKSLIVLVRLQTLDLERDDHQRLIDKTPEILAARQAAVDEAANTVARAHENLTRARATVHEFEVDLQAASDEIKRLEGQMNSAKSNTEYQAFTQRIARIKEESAAKEDDGLELYDRIEALEAGEKAAISAKAASEAELKTFAAECEVDCKAAAEAIAATDDRRRQLLQELPSELSENYERVRRARGGRVVAAVEGRICSSCGINLRPNDVAKLHGCKEIVSCDSCQRILYLPEALRT